MRQKLQQLVSESLVSLQQQGLLSDSFYDINIILNKNQNHGDYSTNIAFIIANKTTPSQKANNLANLIIANLPKNNIITKVLVGGGGFINFFVSQMAAIQIISKIINEKQNFGCSDYGRGRAILLEFVSANPTGPLHIGHGRGAAFGSSLANILSAVGFSVNCEYYINDAGRQMDILTLSIYLRYLEKCGQKINLPDSAYKGNYIKDIAIAFQSKYKHLLLKDWSSISPDCNSDNKELYIDQLINNTKTALGDHYQQLFTFSINSILTTIKSDLADFGINYDNWFKEQSLIQSNLVQNVLDKLQQQRLVYQKSGALWFKSSDFGDEKDRVVVRENGQSTYFASDIAYHANKFARGQNYYKIINIWGADHHGYIARVRAAVSALGLDNNNLEILLVQFANLYRGEVKLVMSTRAGEFISLKKLIDEVGSDAARFFYVLRRSDQHLDFDLELAKAQTNDNPMYYIQYAYARIFQVLAKVTKLNTNNADMSLLVDNAEVQIIKQLNLYSTVLLNAANSREVHQLAYYLKSLATDFHHYYAKCEFLGKDKALTTARLVLISAVAQVLKNGLNLLGVSAPKQM